MVTMNQSSPTLTISTNVSHAPNIAPVLEFRCLYTSDLRRKQKRWQDGRLQFHAFNKRVMVYDDRSNFVGDTHWRKDHDFDDGEELMLERGGIMVEVGEYIGKRDQDLTELVNKRVREREERVAAKNASTPVRPQASSNPQTPSGSALLRPKSLNAVLGNPSGHYGKAAISNLSPFEQRQHVHQDEPENERPAKRRKQAGTPPSKNGYAQNLMGTKINLASSVISSSASIRYEPFKARFQSPTAVTIDLTGNDEPKRPDVNREGRPAANFIKRQSKKSPPARSGYASNLTGVSLNLGKAGSAATKQSLPSCGLTKKTTHLPDDIEYSFAAKLDSVAKYQEVEERSVKRRALNESAPKKTVPSLPNASRCSSSAIISCATSSAHSSSNDEVTQDPSADRIPDRLVSALRIKSRPRKMMMLMECPRHRSSGVINSSNQSVTVRGNLQISNAAASSQRPALSQAMKHLNGLDIQQNQRLPNRLDAELPTPEPEESSSSPTDSGIDHRIIDKLLSGKSKQPQRLPPESAIEAQQRLSSKHLQKPKEKEKFSRAKNSSSLRASLDAGLSLDVVDLVSSKSSKSYQRGVDLDSLDAQESIQQVLKISEELARSNTPLGGLTSSIGGSPPEPRIFSQPQNPRSPASPRRSVFLGAGGTSSVLNPLMKGLATEGNSDLPARKTFEEHVTESTYPHLLDSVKENGQNLEVSRLRTVPFIQQSVSSQNKIPNENLKKGPTTITPHSQSPRTNTSILSVDIPQTTLANGTIVNQNGASPITPESESAVLAGEAPPKPPPLHANCLDTIGSEINPLNSIVKSSTSFVTQGIGKPLLSERPVSLSPMIVAQKPEPASSSVVIKRSPTTSPPISEELVGDAPQEENIDPTMGIKTTPHQTVGSLPNAKSGQPKPRPKLINPATRGPSIQTTANRTVNALAPTFNAPAMLPPTQHIFVRPARNLVQNEAEDVRMDEAVRRATQDGPWSRESFDLFGTWRPPGRDGGPNTVNT